IEKNTGKKIVYVDQRYFRPTEVDTLLGDPTLARERLGWQAEITFEELVREMVAADLSIAKKDTLIEKAGYRSFNYNE
ncbi:MAG: GDP-mannose 4,6-dehydratase, partial [Cryomorphaceae bacterium]